MNIKIIKDKWIKFYKRGFITGLMVLSFICLIDQVLQNPFFFNKIDSENFMLTISPEAKAFSISTMVFLE